MSTAYIDDNNKPTLIGVSSVDGFTPTRVKVNPSTGRVLVDLAASSGITSINTDTTAAQVLAVGTAGTDFAVVDNGTGTHTFNLPTASATNRGALSTTDWSTFNAKGAGTVTAVSVTTANGVSGSVATSTTTPAITLTLGAITPSTVNGNTITTGTGTLTLGAGKTATVSNTLTFTGTDSSSVAFGAGGTVAYTNVATLSSLTSANGSTIPASTTLVGTGTTNTLTNKRVTRRLTTTNAPGATPTTNTDNVDIMSFTGLATAITSMTTNLSGTPVDGDLLEFRFLDNGTARGITWGPSCDFYYRK